ncbi:MAG: SPOR domain-containing protein [Spirochaetaceae bacterium]|nr:SPOR domain-containing protein [Spirochaetaceae bacterium]
MSGFRRFAALLCAALGGAAGAGGALSAFDSGASAEKPLYIADEFHTAVTELESSTSSPAARHDAFARLARLLQLSGSIEEAAKAWENAAYSISGKRDDTALVEGASCYVSMGEWDKAEDIVKLLLLTSRDDKNISNKAAYLNGQIEMFKNGDSGALEAIADNPEFISFRPAVYYMLFEVSGKDIYKTKLINEFPGSPEAYSIMPGATKLVSTLPAPHWVLFPGRENIHVETAKTGPAPGKSDKTAPKTVLRSLQAGLYKDPKNASAQVERIKAAGFSASVVQRGAYWAVFVNVPPGTAVQNIISRLKERGFEAFPSPVQTDS